MNRLIGFTGPAGSGKDTCGAYLVQMHGFARLSFAEPIYKALQVMGFRWPTTQAEKEEVIPELGVTWRHLAQTLGTEWGREKVHQDMWTIVAKRRIESVPSARFAITDVRFDNEAAMIRDLGGLVIHLQGRRAGTGNDAHKSERPLAVQTGDIVLHNNKSPEEAFAALLHALDARDQIPELAKSVLTARA